MKFLHAADIHLDSKLKNLIAYPTAPIERIRGATRRAFRRMIDLAIREQVDLVVIAGDLYDGDWAEMSTGLYFVSEIKRLVDHSIPVVIIRGNHDAQNLMTHSLPLPRNPDGKPMTLSHSEAETRVFEDLGIAVHGQSYATRHVTENLAASYPQAIQGLFNLGVLHTALNGREGHEPYCPCTVSELIEKNYDYWALGHIHTREVIQQSPGVAPIVFPGNTQGRSVRETGARGCYIVDVGDDHQCELKFHQLDDVRWHAMRLDATSFQGDDDIGDAFVHKLEQTTHQDPHRIYAIRVELIGESDHTDQWCRRQDDLLEQLRARAIESRGAEVFLEKLKVRTTSVSHSVDRSGPLASLTHVLSQMNEDEQWVEEVLQDLSSLKKKIAAAQIDLGGIQEQDPHWWSDRLETAAAGLRQTLGGGDAIDDAVHQSSNHQSSAHLSSRRQKSDPQATDASMTNKRPGKFPESNSETPESGE